MNSLQNLPRKIFVVSLIIVLGAALVAAQQSRGIVARLDH